MSNSYVTDEIAELPPLPGTLGTPTLSNNNILNPQTIAFVDANVANAMSLMENLDADVKVLLDSTRDGISQITETLGQYKDLAGISIFSHGSVAQLQLGSSLLNESSLQQYGDRLQQWQSSLTPNADILLYACGVAQGDDGETFLKNFDTLTGADIAASTNLTGASSYGGDWLLEYSTGAIEMAQPITSSLIDDYSGLLAPIFLSDLTPTSATSGWGPFERDRSNGERAANDGVTMKLNGLTYTKGLGVHASSDIIYNLGGGYTRFTSDIGVDDEVGNTGSVVFQVWADGVEIYDSGTMTGSSTTKNISLDVTGKQNLSLRVLNAGDNDNADHADWANAQLESVSLAPDTTAPSATLNASSLATSLNSTTPYTFTVNYSDNVAVNFSTIDSTDLRVTGPNNYNQAATFVSATPATNGSPLVATYQIAAPNGSWDANEAGVYSIALQGNQVADTSGNAIAAATLGTFQVAVGGSAVYLSDLTPTSATNGWGPFERDKSNGETAANDGVTMKLNGSTYTKGLGVHAESDIIYNLGGGYTRFTSDIGVDDEVGNTGSVVFQVWADGVQLYNSGTMTGSSTTQNISVDVSGKQNLSLRVLNAGDNKNADHADWANAQLEGAILAPDTVAPVATLDAATFNTAPSSTTPYTFKVTYKDDVAVKYSTLDSTDLRVTGPNNYSQLATFISATPTIDGSPIVATYQIAAPNGSWDNNEAGNYTVALQGNQVTDTSSNASTAVTLGTFQVVIGEAATYLSDLTPISAANGWGPFERDKSNGEIAANDGVTMSLNGTVYSRGLGVHSSSDIVYNLGGSYTRFISDIGVDDEVGNTGSVVFQVWADGVQVYDSGTMTGSSTTKNIDLDVTGKNNLSLRVLDAGDNKNADHADWARARFISTPDNSPPIPLLTAVPIGTSISTPYTFTVNYTDATAVNASTISSSDIQITGSNGFSQLAQLKSLTPNTNSPSVTATYQIAAPDAIWNWNDRGTYTATLLAGKVKDTIGNTTVSSTVLGTFPITVESDIVIGTNSFQVVEGGSATIPIQRIGDTTGSATIDYYVGGNTTATPNVNYVPVPRGTLSFAPGETQKTVTIQTLDDGAPDTNKTLSLLAENPTGADLGPSRTSTISIRDKSAFTTTYLSDLTATSASNGWGPIEIDKSNGERAAGDGNTLSLSGVSYNKGLGAHADSEITYNLGGAYNSFASYVGVDDEVGPDGSVVFRILADGVLLFDSGVMTGTSKTQLANIDVTGKQTLTLAVNNGDNTYNADHADWADAQLIVGTFTPPPPPLAASREQVVSGLTEPITFTWTPDSQLMFIAEKGGIVKTFAQPTSTGSQLTPGLQPNPFIDISDRVNNALDRGLLGMEIDPRFGKNEGRDYVYLLYTYDPPETQGKQGLAAPDTLGNRPARLIRVTADSATNYTTVLPNSEVLLLGKNSLWQYTSRPDLDSTLIENINVLPSGITNGSTIVAPAALVEDADPANIGRDYSATDTNFDANNNIRDYMAGDSSSHSIGQLKFGLDGSLYVTIGDGTSYNEVDPRSTRVQDVDNLSGKLLRINPITGQGYADNPFSNGNLDSNRSKVWSLGIRNTFRFTINPTTGTPYLGDVGWTTWEEVNVATKGANFGWPFFEGPTQNLGYSALPQAQAFYNSGQPVVAPLITRNHDATQNPDARAATALIMGDFYTGNTLPTFYNGALFYNDVGIGTVYAALLNPDGTVKSTQAFDNLPYIVDTEMGPDGYLYYASLYDGVIGRWKSA